MNEQWEKQTIKLGKNDPKPGTGRVGGGGGDTGPQWQRGRGWVTMVTMMMKVRSSSGRMTKSEDLPR